MEPKHSDAKLGVYCLANDAALEWFQAFVRSFRKFYPDLPLTVIPYNSQIQQLQSLAGQYSFSLMDEKNAGHFDSIASRVAGQRIAGGTFRKLACFLGAYDCFLFLDSDIVLTMALQHVFAAFVQSHYDLVYFDTDIQVFKPDFAREMMGKYDQFGFNSGAFLARKRALSEACILQAVASGETIRDQFDCWGEQPFLNYLCQVTRCRMTHIHRLAPEMTFKPKVWSTFVYDVQANLYRDPERGQLPLIHWAGHEWPTMPRPEVFLKFRTLGMSMTERRRYLRYFYYRRLRAQLKERLKKSQLFSGWVARRDNRLRQQRLQAAKTE